VRCEVRGVRCDVLTSYATQSSYVSLDSFPTTACPSLCAIPAFPVKSSSSTYSSHVTGKFEDHLCTHINKLSYTIDDNAGRSCTHANSRLMMRRALMLNRRRVPLSRHSSCSSDPIVVCRATITDVRCLCSISSFMICARFGMSAHTRRGPATFGCVLRIDHAEMLPGIVVIMY
jgi:hypothetical protein